MLTIYKWLRYYCSYNVSNIQWKRPNCLWKLDSHL